MPFRRPGIAVYDFKIENDTRPVIQKAEFLVNNHHDSFLRSQRNESSEVTEKADVLTIEIIEKGKT